MPDFSPLDQDFIILNQDQSTSASWINGKTSKTIKWTLNVIAKKVGTVTIPAIAFGSDMSNPLSIEVTKGDTNKAVNTDEDLFLEVEATPLDPYLQSQ